MGEQRRHFSVIPLTIIWGAAFLWVLLSISTTTQAADIDLYWRDVVSDDITWEDGVYKIYCPEELALMAQWVNEGNSADQTYELMNDLDLGGREWTAIGRISNHGFAPTHTEYNFFQGTFEGNGFTIYNLYINVGNSREYQGLFGFVGPRGVLKHLTLESFYVRGGGHTAALAGAVLMDNVVACRVGRGFVAGVKAGLLTNYSPEPYYEHLETEIFVNRKHRDQNASFLDVTQSWKDMVSSDITWEGGVYKIYCSEELALMAQWVNSGCSTDVTYELMNDLDLDGREWIAIGGTTKIWAAKSPFMGTFEGNRHRISNIYINKPEQIMQGLFGHTMSSAMIKNLTLENFDVYGYEDAAALVGMNEGMVLDCCLGSGRVRGTGKNVGSMVGGGIPPRYTSVK